MPKFEATFEVESKSDALAVERLMNRLYDAIREETRTLREGTQDSTEMLSQFEAVRDATRRTRPGRLTISYEQDDEGFDA